MTKEMKYNRIRAIETLDTTEKMSGSKLFQSSTPLY